MNRNEPKISLFAAKCTHGKSPVRALGRTLAVCMTLVLFLTVSVFALPVMQENIYVYDEADVITDEAEADINARAKAIFALTGARVETVCLKNTGDKTTSEYAIDLFSEWKLGTSDKNNGILILLSIEGNDYWTIQGAGLKSSLTDAELQKINNECLEPDFAAKKYGDGVKKTFDALLGKLEAIYSVDISSWDPNAPAQNGAAPVTGSASEQKEQNSGFSMTSFFRIMLIIILVVAGIITAMTVFAFIRRPRYVGTGGSKRRHYKTERGAYVSTPSRSDLDRVRTRRPSGAQTTSRGTSGGRYGSQDRASYDTRNGRYEPHGDTYGTQSGVYNPQRGARMSSQGRTHPGTQQGTRGAQGHGTNAQNGAQYPYGKYAATTRQDQHRIRQANSASPTASNERRHEHATVYPERPPYIDRTNIRGNRGDASGRNGGKK